MRKQPVSEKAMGGMNFLVVLWTLLTLLKFSVEIKSNFLEFFSTGQIFTIIIPLIFLTVLNLFIAITSFTNKGKNTFWVLSIAVVSLTLFMLNSAQQKINIFNDDVHAQSSRWEF